MSRHTFTLRHRLYTYTANEPGQRNVSLGDLDAEGDVPPNIMQSIDELLAALTAEGEEAYAVQRFGAPGEANTFLCLASSHEVKDAYGRRASRNHARILFIDTPDAWLDIQALIGLAENFQLGAVFSRSVAEMGDYLRDEENSVDAGDWNDTPLRNIDGVLARTVIENCLSSVNRQEAQVVSLPPQPSSIDVLRDVAAAWSSLPWPIQRASSFSVGALAGAKVKLRFATKGKTPAPVVNAQTREFASDYIAWVLDRPDDARTLIVNPAIRDAQTLSSALRQSSEPPVLRHEEPEMAKNKRPAEAPRGELNQAVMRYINEQVANAEMSLREYVDRWKSSVEPRSPRTNPGAALPPGTPPIAESRRSMSELAMASAAGAIGGAAMAVLVVFLMRPHPPDEKTKQVDLTATQTATTMVPTDTKAPVPPATSTPADKLPGQDWAQRFQGLCDREPRRLGALATSISANETLSAKTEKSFTVMRDQLNAGRPLPPQDGKLLRVILFQMLAHQISGLQIAVDGQAGPATAAAVPALVKDLQLESKMGNADEIANLQAETILRWAARGNL